MKITPERITRLAPNEVFVFGSNLAGRHGKGAALMAKKKFGAIRGQGEGLMGQCYGIPIKDARDRNFKVSMDIPVIEAHVTRFVEYAKQHPQLEFLVTAIGCGLGGYRPDQMAPLFTTFHPIPPNVSLPQSFWDVINK